ncbi:MAG: hypothetical protein IT502_16005 [Rubrivivax sp.]|nr:hypothetical protein [Rubrivivax sp.]
MIPAAWPPLHAAVRRRLWLRQAAAAARAALWCLAALALLALLLHLVVRPLPLRVVPALAAVLALAALAWSAARRPSEDRCALWADRELGGASAFTTLLDARRGRLRGADAQALQCLQTWAAAQVPAALAALPARRVPMRLARPFAAAVVCTALALLVLALPGAGPAAPGEAASAAGAPARPTTDAPAAPAASELARQVASALRTEQGSDPARTGAGGRDAARGDDDARERNAGGPPPGATAAAPAHPVDAPATQAERKQAAAPSTGGTGGSTGREAGDSADTRRDSGRAPVPQGTMSTRRVEAAAPPGAGRADDAQAAQYDAPLDAAAPAPGRRPARVVRAATPPPAAATTHLTADETHYVQAWMSATASRR